jgi:DNA-binding response OmpR family regulator
VTVLMLLDRQADVHLAKRSAADAWLVKPFDPLTLQRAVRDVLAGPVPPPPMEEPATDEAAETAEEEAPVAG